MSSFKLRNEQEPANRNLPVKDRQVKYEIDVWHAKPDPVTGRRRAQAPVAAVSNGFWTRAFPADPGVLGKSIQLNPAASDDRRRYTARVCPHAG